jgi:hypothetical protein
MGNLQQQLIDAVNARAERRRRRADRSGSSPALGKSTSKAASKKKSSKDGGSGSSSSGSSSSKGSPALPVLKTPDRPTAAKAPTPSQQDKPRGLAEARGVKELSVGTLTGTNSAGVVTSFGQISPPTLSPPTLSPSDRPMELGETARRRSRLSDVSCKSDLSDVSIDSSFFEQQSSMGESDHEQDLTGFDELEA